MNVSSPFYICWNRYYSRKSCTWVFHILFCPSRIRTRFSSSFFFLIRFRLFSRWDLRRAAIFISHQRCFVFTKGPDLEKCIIRLMMDPTAYHKIQIESIEPLSVRAFDTDYFFFASPPALLEFKMIILSKLSNDNNNKILYQ